MRRLRLLAILSSVLLAVLSACGGDNGATVPDSGDTNQVKAWSAAIETQSKAAAHSHQAVLDAVRVASGDFQVDLSVEPAPGEAVAPYGGALEAAIVAQAAAYRASVDAASWAARSAQAPATGGGSGGGLEVRREPLVFVLLVAAGVALTGWGAKKGLDKAVDARAQPVSDKIAAATTSELDLVKDELGLDPGATREETLAHFQGLGLVAKNTAAKNLEAALLDAANQTVANPEISEVDATEIRKSVAKSAVACGEIAVTTTVSLATTATGGQGYTQALEAVGLGSTAAAVVDLGITAVSTATDTPLQPLDILASNLNVTVVSKETRPVSIPKPDVRLEAAEATNVLASVTATATQQEAAAASLALDVIEAHSADLAPRTEADGSVTVDVPAMVHTTLVADPTVQQELVVPQMPGDGRADVLVAATDMVPTVFEAVDTTQRVELMYPAVSVEPVEVQEPPDGWEPWCQADGEWACDENDCVRDDQICDGVADCTNGADEGDFCTGSSSGCEADEFDCADGDLLEPGVECIPLDDRCDGTVDCFLSDQDEVGCE